MSKQLELEHALDDFCPETRMRALRELAGLGLPAAATSDNHNMHFHSFFSFNAEGWSPSHIAWASHQAGLYAAGLCDFDVLDGLEEFLRAGQALGLRATVNLETRAFLREFATADINSPGEPGVTYIMGCGFAHMPDEGTPQAAGLAALREAARTRNVELVARINPHIPQIAVDYEADVLPLTPLGGATERHIIRAYVNKAAAVCGSAEATANLWAQITGKPAADILPLLSTPAHEELVRSRLVKSGGIGYVQPSEDTFPPVDDFIAWVLSCRAIPTITWLDGTSEGERDPHAMIECLTAKGCAALNIVPDRNWNIKDLAAREQKVANLAAMVAAADEAKLPINIGTEMNKAGLPFVDDLSGPVLSRFRDSFLRGCQVMVGHSILLRYADVSYVTYDAPVADKNRLFGAVGALPPLTCQAAEALEDLGPEAAFAAIQDAVRRGSWA